MTSDDLYYRQVEQELREGKFEPGLGAKALAEANGDEGKARALYIRLRVKSLKTEAAAGNRRAIDHEEQQRLSDLTDEAASLDSVARYERKRIVLYGLVIGLIIGGIAAVRGIIEDAPGLFEGLGVVLVCGASGAVLGYILANNVSTNARLRQIKRETRYVRMSPTWRRICRVCAWILGIVYVAFILSRVLRH